MKTPLRTAAHPAGQTQSGFTLIEIMIVVVIIGILAAMVVPNVIGKDYQAQATAARNDLRVLSNALDLYRLDNHAFPSSEDGLQALIERPSGLPEGGNWTRYVKGSLPKDPWRNHYVYETYGDGYELYSLGADGQEGGEGNAQDIAFDQ